MRRNNLIWLLLPLLLGACGRLNGVDQGDPGTVVWTGRLVKDCTQEPAANVVLRLEASFLVDIFNSMYEDEKVAECVTDAEGYFTLVYKRILRPNCMSVDLLTGSDEGTGSMVYGALPNRDFYRNFSLKKCDLTHVIIDNAVAADTVYLGLGRPQGTDYYGWDIVKIKADTIDTNFKYSVHRIALNGLPTYSYTVASDRLVGYSYGYEEYNGSCLLTRSLDDMREAIKLNLLSEPNPWRYNFTSSGYHKVDTVHVVVPEE